MLDKDLAEIYQVETRVLNQAVKRNIERFPNTFRFQLTYLEMDNLVKNCERFSYFTSENQTSKSQNVTLNNQNSKRGKNIKYLPFAFTEQGVAMLSAVLRSNIAVKVSIQIINTFVELRKIINENSGLIQRMELIEKKQLQNDVKFDEIFNALEGNTIPTQGVFYNGQIFDAYQLASKIIRTAKKRIVLIDNYINEETITHLSKKEKGVEVILLTKTISNQLELDVKKANEQYGSFELKIFTQSHDRFLILDDKEVYHLGASLKDLGKKWFAFSKLEIKSVEGMVEQISNLILRS
jgi:hypothetical protein